ncbi:DUF1990 family protein [Haloactinopolyspora alba]|uniref:DUF1990 family protein n=1 Tax=Haloactinopolyspora alba TaxID=648780 RepID=UPI001FD0167F|nr:DUF1990 domain-containing protein [Haloactinopolyspora alba]
MTQSQAMAEFTYPEVGATRGGGPLPDGYRHSRVRERVGSGRRVHDAVADGLLGWALHRRCGLRVQASAERAAPGVRVVSSLGVGPLRVRIPCEVVWAVDEARHAGFAYGTLPGHPARGEEAFVVDLDDNDDVWFSVTAFSRSAAWYARLGGPVTHAVQNLALRRYVTAARELASGRS